MASPAHITAWCQEIGGRVSNKADDDESFLFDDVKGPRALNKLRKTLAKTKSCDPILIMGKNRLIEDRVLPALGRAGLASSDVMRSCLRLVVQYTMPVGTSFYGDSLAKKGERDRHLRRLRDTFADSDTGACELLGVVLGMCLIDESDLNVLESSDKFFKVETRSEGRRTRKAVAELVLWLIRNLLVLEDESQNDLKDFCRLVETLHSEKLLAFVSLLCKSTADHATWNHALLEVVWRLLYRFEPRALASRSFGDEDDVLSAALNARKAVRMATLRKASSRHSRFGALVSTRAVTTPTTVAKRNFFGGRPVALNENLRLDDVNPPPKPVKMLVVVKEEVALEFKLPPKIRTSARVPTPRCKRALRSVADSLVTDSFFELTHSLKSDFKRRTQGLYPSDKIRYFDLVSFCLDYQRELLKSADLKGSNASRTFNWESSPLLVSLDVFSFEFTLSHLVEAFESKPCKHRMASSTLRTFNSMLECVFEMERSSFPSVSELGSRLKAKVFRRPADLEICADVLADWDPKKHPLELLVGAANLANSVLETTSEMDSSGARVYKGRSSSSKTVVRRKWKREETVALVEAVRELLHSGTTIEKVATAILRANKSVCAMILDESHKNVRDICARYNELKSVKTEADLEAFFDAEADKDDSEDEEVVVVIEKSDDREEAVRFEQTLNRFVRRRATCFNIARLLDMNDEKADSIACSLMTKISRFNVDAGSYDDDNESSRSLCALFWRIDCLNIFERFLRRRARSQAFGIVSEIVRNMFQAGNKHPFVYVDALFPFNKGEALSMSNGYADVGARFALERENETRDLLHKRYLEAEDEHGGNKARVVENDDSSSNDDEWNGESLYNEQEKYAIRKKEYERKRRRAKKASEKRAANKQAESSSESETENAVSPALFALLKDVLDRASASPNSDTVVVPRSRADVEIINDSESARAMRLRGFLAPNASQQRMYWTLPANSPVSVLRNKLAVKKKKKRIARPIKKRVVMEDSSDDSDSSEAPAVVAATKKRRKIVADSDSSSSEDDQPPQPNRQKLVVSDSD